ncbi:hypothetical protein OV203_21845 [Nannocystis sp. ILAH1]|uniref:hypothetical protein n=1 Tax=Nannocystis sp. ILAH1 TaxID=2996789 RepID=UPI0022720693|nr:hypothetical protein [Nannocystis sp. ILAH1]MCY0989796.1 hypothetical protein [Nannocystis sp. ILAH1]
MSITNRVLTAVFTVTAGATALAPASASANNPCQSEWVKFKNFFDQNGAKIGRGVCQLVNKSDTTAAKKCVDDFEAVKQKIDAKLAEYNTKADDSQWKIGPRGLGEATWATGTLLAERTFAGAPVLSDSYRLELQRTGGKATKPMRGTVCFLDSDGNMALPAATFTIDAGRPTYDNTFTGIAGLSPVILLEKPIGLNGHQYQIRGTRGIEPSVVHEARQVAAGAKAAKMRGGQ